MKNDLISSFLRGLATDAQPYQPLLKQTVEDFERLIKASEERSPTGGRTKLARQAAQSLRNKTLRTGHPNAAAAAAARAVKATGEQFGKDAEKAVKSWAIWYQAQLEHYIQSDKSSDVSSTRESGTGESREDVRRLLDELKKRNVPPHAVGRLRSFQYDVLALAIDHGNNDRQFERPDNFWCHLVHHGVLTAYHDKIDLAEDEVRLIAEASAYLSDPESFALREKLEERIGRRLNVHPELAAGCQIVLANGDELTTGEAEALFTSSGARFSEHSIEIATLLGLGSDETTKVDAFVKFLTGLRYEGAGLQNKLSWIVHALTTYIDDLADRHLCPSEWLPALSQAFLQPSGLIDRNVPDEGAFWTLLALALERSRAHREFEAARDLEDDRHREADREYRIEMYRAAEISFFVDAEGEVHTGKPSAGQNVRYFVEFEHGGDDDDARSSDDEAHASVAFVNFADPVAVPSPSIDPTDVSNSFASFTASEGLAEASIPNESQNLTRKIEICSPSSRRDTGGDLFEGME